MPYYDQPFYLLELTGTGMPSACFIIACHHIHQDIAEQRLQSVDNGVILLSGPDDRSEGTGVVLKWPEVERVALYAPAGIQKPSTVLIDTRLRPVISMEMLVPRMKDEQPTTAALIAPESES